MKLYAHPMSCSLAPHVSLLQAGVRFELVWVDFYKRTEDGRDYYSIASKGQYPVLQFEDGAILTELAAILQWIADQAPHSGLAPAHGSMERARLQEWLCYIGTEIHKQVFWTYFNADKQSEVPADGLRRYLLGILGKRFDNLERTLPTERFLFGESLSVADAYLLPMLNWAQFVKFDLAEWPTVATYYRRLIAWPTVQRAHHIERAKRTSLLVPR